MSQIARGSYKAAVTVGQISKPSGIGSRELLARRDKQLLIHIVRKSRPRFTKSLSLVLIRLVLTEIQPFKNVKIINKEMFGHPDTASGWPCISL